MMMAQKITKEKQHQHPNYITHYYSDNVVWR